MAREHARLLVRINADRDFAELDVTAQWLFSRLTARQELNYAGVLQLDAKRWARMSKHVTVQEVEKAVATLRTERYLLVDDETDEVLIRSLIRNDEVAKQPNVLKSALRAAEFVESPAIRAELAIELRRVRTVAKDWLQAQIDRTLDLLDPRQVGSRNPSANPPPDPFRDPSANPVQSISGDPSSDGSVEVVVVGEVEGESPPAGRSLGGSAGEREAAGPREDPTDDERPVVPPKSERPDELCSTHRADPSATGACRGCRRAREAAEEFDRRRTLAIRACRMCDAEESLLELGRALPVSPRTRCDHRTDQRQQVADARDEAS